MPLHRALLTHVSASARRYEAMAQSLEADKERCNREILAMLDTLVEHKNYIETTLADLLTTVSSA